MYYLKHLYYYFKHQVFIDRLGQPTQHLYVSLWAKAWTGSCLAFVGLEQGGAWDGDPVPWSSKSFLSGSLQSDFDSTGNPQWQWERALGMWQVSGEMSRWPLAAGCGLHTRQVCECMDERLIHIFLRLGFVWPSLTSNSPYSWGWLEPLIHNLHLLVGLQVSVTMTGSVQCQGCYAGLCACCAAVPGVPLGALCMLCKRPANRAASSAWLSCWGIVLCDRDGV